MKALLSLIILTLFMSGACYADLSGYTKHGTSNGVTLYYKVKDYAIHFKAENNTGKTVHVRIYDVSAQWSDNRTRVKDVKITYVPKGKIRTGTYDHADNYSKINGSWKFDSWAWSTNLKELRK